MKKLTGPILAALIVATPASNALAQDEKPTTEEAAKPAPAEESKPGEVKSEPAKEGEAKADAASVKSDDVGALGKHALEMARAGKWFAMIGAGILFLVGMIRKSPIKWFKTRIGGWTLAGLGGVGTVIFVASQVGFGADAIAAGLTAAGFGVAGHHALADAMGSAKKKAKG